MSEIYYLSALGFNLNVTKAEHIVRNRTPKRVAVSKLIPAINDSGVFINKDHVKNGDVDLSRPIMLATVGTMVFLFDGNHRVTKAAKVKRKFLNVHTLTEAETRKIATNKKNFDKFNYILPTALSI